jgi:hypothetical protein
MSDLSDLLGAHRPGNTSNRQIALKTGLAPATVDKCMNGRHGIVEEPTLHALSDYFHIPIEKLRMAANVPAGEGQPWTPPPEADRLNRRQRDAIDEMIRSIVAADASRTTSRVIPVAANESQNPRWGPTFTGEQLPGVGRDQNGHDRDQLGGR